MRAKRQILGKQLKQAAEDLGISSTTLYRIETGQKSLKTIPDDWRQRFEVYFGVSLESLLKFFEV